MKAAESRGLWVAPFGEVAAYFRAQKIVEAAQPQVANGETEVYLASSRAIPARGCPQGRGERFELSTSLSGGT